MVSDMPHRQNPPQVLTIPRQEGNYSFMSHMEISPYRYFWWCEYSQGSWVSFITTDESLVRVAKIISRISVLWTHSLPSRFLLLFWLHEIVILSKERRPDNFESHNSLKMSFTNNRGFRSNFVGCESFLESKTPGILALCKTNLDGSIDSGNSSAKCYLTLI